MEEGVLINKVWVHGVGLQGGGFGPCAKTAWWLRGDVGGSGESRVGPRPKWA